MLKGLSTVLAVRHEEFLQVKFHERRWKRIVAVRDFVMGSHPEEIPVPRGDQPGHFSQQVRHQNFAADADAAKALNTRRHLLIRSGL
ncbi:MAG: hypothetical protein ABSC06_14645 [Rhodopila sp.]|jgi:hypothetical protein